MTRAALSLLAAAWLAGCGVEGAPERPAPATGSISISGTVEMGISKGGIP